MSFPWEVHTLITQTWTEIHFPKTLHHSRIQVALKYVGFMPRLSDVFEETACEFIDIFSSTQSSLNLSRALRIGMRLFLFPGNKIQGCV